MLRNIPSCGLTLLRSPPEAHDYVLKITCDDVHYVHINCHRCVLLAHSRKLQELITCENYYSLIIRVAPGYVGACVELLQYMYLRDISLITDKAKMLEMCGLFDMPSEFYLVHGSDPRLLNHVRQPIAVSMNWSTDVKDGFLAGTELLRRIKMGPRS